MVGPSFGRFGAALTNWVTVTLNAYISINHALEEQSTGDPVKLLVEERPISGRNQDMDIGQVITFHFLRNDGRRERTKLDHYDLAQARILVEQVFRMGNGLYTEVDLCTESGQIETIQNLHPTLADFQRI